MNINLNPEFLAVSTWLWDALGKEFVSSTISAVAEEAQKKWQKFEWEKAAKQYRERVYGLYATMRMLGNPNPVSVEGLFTELYILDRPTAWRRHNIDKLKSELENVDELEDPADRVRAVDWINQQDRLFILGKPGAGKTTLMKYVTLLASRGVINKIPIFVSLNDWAQRKISLQEYINLQFEICSFPDAEEFIKETLLRKGRTIIFFDGLDEVNEENDRRREITRAINDFTNQYSKNKFLITCRVAASDYTFDNFSYVEIADFTIDQIKTFALKWFNNQPGKGARFTSELSNPKYAGLRELAKTPILLNLLCLSYDETLTFPPRLVDIYQEALDALLKKWDASRNIKRDEIYRGLSSVRKQQLLARIAAEYFEQAEIFFTEFDLTKRVASFIQTLPDPKSQEVDAEVIVKALEAQHGILVERAHKIHSFSHLTFQEYFTSRYIVENYSDNQLGQMMQYLKDKRWHEIFLMSASLLSNADRFFDNFKENLDKSFSKTKILKAFHDKNLSDLAPLTYIQRLLVFDISLRKNLSIMEDIDEALIVIHNLQEAVNKGDLKNVPNIAKPHIFLFQELYNKFITPKSYAGFLEIPVENLKSQLFSPAEFTNVNKNLQAIDKNLKIISKKYLEVSYLGNNDSHVYVSLEQQRFNQLIETINVSLKTAKENLDLIDKIVGIQISSYPAHWPIANLAQTEIGDFLYLNTLLIECVNVAAVSNREKILIKMCLQ